MILLLSSILSLLSSINGLPIISYWWCSRIKWNHKIRHYYHRVACYKGACHILRLTKYHLDKCLHDATTVSNDIGEIRCWWQSIFVIRSPSSIIVMLQEQRRLRQSRFVTIYKFANENQWIMRQDYQYDSYRLASNEYESQSLVSLFHHEERVEWISNSRSSLIYHTGRVIIPRLGQQR